jgi:glyoxylase-like metal-dependent hydrolase (beta-lactamase superfamily II)
MEMAPGLYFIFGENKGRFPSSHGALLVGEETILLDAGIGADRIEQIDKRWRIDTLIISHSHPDHIRYAHELADRRLLLPEQTPESVEDLQSLGERFTGNNDDGSHWAWLVGEVFGVKPLRAPDARYRNDDLFETGGFRLRAIHCPGHLSDHYCFFEEKTATLFSIDIDLTPFGPWYGNPESEIEDFKESVRKIRDIDYKRVCSSHRTPIEGDATDHFNRFLEKFQEQAQMVADLCKDPRSLDQLGKISPFYNDKLPDKRVQYIFEKRMSLKNLEYLRRQGRIIKEGDRFRTISS